MHLRAAAITLTAVLCIFTTGCATAEKDPYRELGPGELALRKITDAREIPDFTEALKNTDDLDAAIAHSLSYLAKPSSQSFFPSAGLTHEQVRVSLEEFRAMLADGDDAKTLNAEIRRRFDVYTTVGYDGEGTILYTGYYTPIFEASLTRDDRFRYPLHKLPANHVKDPLTGETKGLRGEEGSIDPNYPTRRELLNSGMLDGTELVWLSDPVEAYVVQVQGSAILRLADGTEFEVGYAGTNGREYKSIGAELIKRGKLTKAELNLDSIVRYFRKNPQDFDAITGANDRYVFFQQNSGGPFGCLNEQVLPDRSLATDKTIFPRGGLCLVETVLPTHRNSARKVSRFMLDQDAGGAIRAPGRADIYWGSGDAAQQRAGRTRSEGRLYYLVLKDRELRGREKVAK
ncbi:MAG: MltA domain-containing protein [Planctomycetes bacterium]|nr:MltA domain-containing protein [Planctomycetota bacterium]